MTSQEFITLEWYFIGLGGVLEEAIQDECQRKHKMAANVSSVKTHRKSKGLACKVELWDLKKMVYGRYLRVGVTEIFSPFKLFIFYKSFSRTYYQATKWTQSSININKYNWSTWSEI